MDDLLVWLFLSATHSIFQAFCCYFSSH